MNRQPFMIIDIETTGKGYNAPAFAIAAINSNGRKLTARLGIMEQLKRGAIQDDSTIDFWFHQPSADWLDTYELISPWGLCDALNATYLDIVASLTIGQDCPHVWTRGNDFDIPILGNLFARFDVAKDRDWQTWPYWALHNIRTAELITGKQTSQDKSHCPLQDCLDDRKVVEEFYRIKEQAEENALAEPKTTKYEELQ